MAEAMDKDIINLEGQSNRGSLPLSFQPAMPRPPRIRSYTKEKDQQELVPFNAPRLNSDVSIVSRQLSAGSVISANSSLEADEEDENKLFSTLIFHTEYYLTCLRSKEDFKKANIDPEHQRYVKFGRPDLEKLFAETRELCEKEGIRRVAVFTCGPSAMVNEVVDLSRNSKTNCGTAVRFDCHQEVFDF